MLNRKEDATVIISEPEPRREQGKEKIEVKC
jgi:hypothetical protein